MGGASVTRSRPTSNERFFLEVVRPALNRRVRSLVMWEAFRQWCADRNIDTTLSHAMFGRLARWQKGRIGGGVWYLDCELGRGLCDHPRAMTGRQNGVYTRQKFWFSLKRLTFFHVATVA